MPTVTPPNDLEKDPRIKAVFDDIRATRKSDDINAVWKLLAFDVRILETMWADMKSVMSTPSELDLKTKEMIYLAVCIANNSPYCVATHTDTLKRLGMTTAEHGDFLRVVGLAAKTSHLLNAIQPTQK